MGKTKTKASSRDLAIHEDSIVCGSVRENLGDSRRMQFEVGCQVTIRLKDGRTLNKNFELEFDACDLETT